MQVTRGDAVGLSPRSAAAEFDHHHHQEHNVGNGKAEMYERPKFAADDDSYQVEEQYSELDQGSDLKSAQTAKQPPQQQALRYHHHDEDEHGYHEMAGEGEDGEEEEQEEDEEEEEDSASFSDSLSSSPSIPDEDIDFSLVYALHTFLATVDGQASVVKGDKLLLLDDSNSYWWLVRVLKTQAVGYIPAENIETPWERLARLNKHRNVDLTTATQQDVLTGPSSAAAQTRFGGRIPPSAQPHPHANQHPSARGVPASPSHKDHPRNMSPSSDRPEKRSGSSRGKTVNFTAPVYYEHSLNGDSVDEYDEEGMMMMDDDQIHEEGELQGQQEFDDDPEESEFSDDQLTEEDGHEVVGQRQVHESSIGTASEGVIGMVGHVASSNDDTQGWDDETPVDHQVADLASGVHDGDTVAAPLSTTSSGLHPTDSQDPSGSPRREGSIQGREFDEADFQDTNKSTKKITATPPIVRDPNFDINNPFGDLPGGVPERGNSPVKVRGVEVPDVTDPRYNRLFAQPQRANGAPKRSFDEPVQVRSSNEFGRDGDTSLNSMDTTTSSFVSNQSTVTAPSIQSTDDGYHTATLTNPAAKKSKKGRESVDGGDGGDKKKKGGILGLFRKKDKKKKTVDGAIQDESGTRSSDESNRLGSPLADSGFASQNSAGSPRSLDDNNRSSKRLSQTAESMFGTDAALRQQQIEAKQALYHQYGVQRSPGDLSNTMTPRGDGRQPLNFSPTVGGGGMPSPSLQAPQRMRPGSLVGSPSVPGLVDVPVLSVMRVFAGDNVASESTFKTVLLNRSTTTSDLVKQSMQRFRLAGQEEQDDYYLTVKELGGEERKLEYDTHPLEIFETLTEQMETIIPSVKRSSIGSINSISSNLSLNPAISRLGMNDWSDDTAVKFYLNRRRSQTRRHGSELGSGTVGLGTSSHDQSGAEMEGLGIKGGSKSAPSYRFAVRIVVYPSDLPENVVFDPATNAIIPKIVLQNRLQQPSYADAEPVSPNAREKIIFFPRNVNVADVIEAGLDRFGIVDGVVDGGDEVEDRLSKRRSVTRVKYRLTVEKDGQELPLSATSKLLDSYSSPPIFKPYDRSTKEFRRRSVDATLILGTSDDVQPSDPVFVLRRATGRTSATRAPGPVPAKVDELDEIRQQHQKQEDVIARLPPPEPTSEPMRPALERATTAGTTISSVAESFETAREADQETISKASISGAVSKQELIAAQRAATRASQRAILSAHKNQDQGVDIQIPSQGVIRSTRDQSNDQVRYSFVGSDGHEMDISEIVEKEWQGQQQQRPLSTGSTATASSGGAAKSEGSTDTVLDRPSSRSVDSDDKAAIDALRKTDVHVEPQNSTQANGSAAKKGTESLDVLQDAIGPRVTSPTFNESLQERLDRVLAKVKEDRAMGKRPPSRPRSFQLAQLTASGRTTPNGGISPSSIGTGRRSPYSDTGRDSPTIDQLINEKFALPRSRQSSVQQHARQASNASANSVVPTAAEGSDLTMNGRVMPKMPQKLLYRDDFGFDQLCQSVEARAKADLARRPLSAFRHPDGPLHERLFGRSVNDLDLRPETKQAFAEDVARLDEIESKLDNLLQEMTNSAAKRASPAINSATSRATTPTVRAPSRTESVTLQNKSP
ncbi:protein phosphatase regulator [Microbotryomycetes sp. JL201]|nr:protein phosphatase regulator [Microbotryomycetes sp. JL201]